MRVVIEKDIDAHRDRIAWLNEHVGPTTGGRYDREYGKCWRVAKFSTENWIVLNAYEIDNEEQALMFKMRFS